VLAHIVAWCFASHAAIAESPTGIVAKSSLDGRGQPIQAAFASDARLARPIDRTFLHPNVDLAASPSRGPDDAPVTIVVFANFHCSFCVKENLILRQVLVEYPEQVRLVFKHFSWDEAKVTAAATILAYRQRGNTGFWRMHDALMENPRARSMADLRRLAATLGMDLADFDRVLSDPIRVDGLLAQDLAEAQGSGVRNTPTVFINGMPLRPRKYSDYKAQIERVLQGLPPTASHFWKQPSPERSHLGQASKEHPVGIAAFLDAEDPRSIDEYKKIRGVMRMYPDQVRFSIMHSPSPDHPKGRYAAAATALAERQTGREASLAMYSKVLANSNAFDVNDLRTLASELGMDLKQFDRVMADPGLVDALLAYDRALAEIYGIRETPAIIINNYRLSPHARADYVARIEPILEKAKRRDRSVP
jgi:protein-disulfide isomerase